MFAALHDSAVTLPVYDSCKINVELRSTLTSRIVRLTMSMFQAVCHAQLNMLPVSPLQSCNACCLILVQLAAAL
jgi:hypothetical protein